MRPRIEQREAEIARLKEALAEDDENIKKTLESNEKAEEMNAELN